MKINKQELMLLKQIYQDYLYLTLEHNAKIGNIDISDCCTYNDWKLNKGSVKSLNAREKLFKKLLDKGEQLK